jgi:6-phosphofructokinase 2
MAIYTLTLNPAIDLETTVPVMAPGDKLRCGDPVRDPGGGGINVARAITQLGGAATAVVAMQGAEATALGALLAAQNLPYIAVPAPGPMRQNLSVQETQTGRQFRFIFPGPAWGAGDVARVQEAMRALIGAGDWVVVSGSVPPGFGAAPFGDLVRALVGQGAQVVVDTSGAGLADLVQKPPGLALLRVDQAEAEALATRALPQIADSADFAAGLVAQGVARVVIIGRGAQGSVLVAPKARWFAPTAPVAVVSRTGAGDSFVAGAVLAMAKGADLDVVLQSGCAAASAAVTTPATQLCNAATALALLPACAARPV